MDKFLVLAGMELEHNSRDRFYQRFKRDHSISFVPAVMCDVRPQSLQNLLQIFKDNGCKALVVYPSTQYKAEDVAVLLAEFRANNIPIVWVVSTNALNIKDKGDYVVKDYEGNSRLVFVLKEIASKA